VNVIRIDRRTAQIHVNRSALSAAAEDALAANQSARDAIARAEQAVWSGNRGAVLHALGRIGFEVQARTEALMALTQLTEQAVACPDGKAGAPHGAAA
jgi:S-adenosylhomocysteine hydrolase